MKTVVITGASKGLGLAMAKAFAGEGCNLFLCSRGEKALYDAVEELYSVNSSISVKSIPADLATEEGCKEFITYILSHTREIDIIINNAGSFVQGSVYNEPEDNLRQMLDTNLLSAYRITRGLLPLMLDKGKGHIFNITSIAGRNAYSNGGSYSISKWAMEGFGRNLREELKPFGIKVTNVAPGAVFTDSWKNSGVIQNRIMRAEDVAEMVVATSKLSPQACVEEIVLRPQLGDL